MTIERQREMRGLGAFECGHPLLNPESVVVTSEENITKDGETGATQSELSIQDSRFKMGCGDEVNGVDRRVVEG